METVRPLPSLSKMLKPLSRRYWRASGVVRKTSLLNDFLTQLCKQPLAFATLYGP
jgi:hypothetical protein